MIIHTQKLTQVIELLHTITTVKYVLLKHYIPTCCMCFLTAIDAADDEPDPEVPWTKQTDYKVQHVVWLVLTGERKGQ